MSLPIVAFTLAEKRELSLGDDIRLFLVQEPDAEGVGLEWARPSRQQANCTQTSVTYLLWEGQSENTTYCQCYDGRSGALLSPESTPCD